MKYKAVIFDLFGTLVDAFGGRFCTLLQQEGVLAPLTGGRESEFKSTWEGHDVRRMLTLGILDTPADAIRYVCDKLSIAPDSELLARAVDIRMDYCSAALTPRDGTVESLSAIRQTGRKMALLSACSSEIPWLWPRTDMAEYFDEALFSCQVGLAKPHKRFYELAAERLDVPTDECLYVGDGACKELIGALDAGMDAALLYDPAAEPDSADRPVVRTWDGATVANLAGVMNLLANGAALSVA